MHQRDRTEEFALPHHGTHGALQVSETAKEIATSANHFDIYICAGFNNSYYHPTTDWLKPSTADTSNCNIECTNIGNPEESDLDKRYPNLNKKPIEIHDA